MVCENVTDVDEEVDNVVVSREEDEGKEEDNVVVSGVEDKGKDVDVGTETDGTDVGEAVEVPPVVLDVGDDVRVVDELDVDAEPVLAVEDIELVSPQIDAMLLLSVLMYPVNFVSFSSK